MNEIWDLINKSNSILVLTHENPDGDAIGSAMAIYKMLINLNKNVDVVIPEIPPVFMFLNSMDKILVESNKNYELAIVVDCSNAERIGQKNDEFAKCQKSIVIDHHISNTRFCYLNYVMDKTSSCSQVIYHLFKEWKIKITKEIGEYLMTGCITDTCGFRNNDVDKATFLMAAEMIDLGVDIHKIYYLTLLKINKAQYQLMRMTLDRLELLHEGKIAFSYISHEDMENVGAKKGDHEGLIDIGRNIEGVEVSIFMREDDGYNVSFRSTGRVNVEKIARRFGGGGHDMAAGVRINKSFKETKDILVGETIREIDI